jgi:Zn-dependent alcohol dehydrogenase
MASLPEFYKAAVFEKANAPLTLKDVPLKAPAVGEVLVSGKTSDFPQL